MVERVIIPGPGFTEAPRSKAEPPGPSPSRIRELWRLIDVGAPLPDPTGRCQRIPWTDQQREWIAELRGCSLGEVEATWFLPVCSGGIFGEEDGCTCPDVERCETCGRALP